MDERGNTDKLRSFSVSRSNTCPFNSGENLELKFGLKSNVEDYKSQNNSLGSGRRFLKS